MPGGEAPSRQKSGATAGVLLAGAVGLLALPNAVLAFTAKFEARSSESVSGEAIDAIDTLATQPGRPNIARPIPIRSLAKGKLYPFTLAETPNRPDRSVTVAVRVDPGAANAISAHRTRAGEAATEGTELRIAPTAFSLGVSRGYQSFGQALVPPASKNIGSIPDLGRYSLTPDTDNSDSRFSPRIIMDEAQSAGRTPGTFAGDSDDRVDVGGSYRVTKNLDVTAGVRYSQERERLLPPLTDGEQDNQAVYLGTQFRF